jgi:hypothetical protein
MFLWYISDDVVDVKYIIIFRFQVVNKTGEIVEVD